MIRWYAVNTQPGKEERAREHLLRQDFKVYLPRCLKRRSHARRVEWVAAPLFPRYLFAGFDIATTRWRAIQSTFGVARLICSGGMPLPAPTGLIEVIRARETEDGLVRIVNTFRKGQKVAVAEGPFAGADALFECENGDMRVTILLDLLGRAVRVKVPAYAIRAA